MLKWTKDLERPVLWADSGADDTKVRLQWNSETDFLTAITPSGYRHRHKGSLREALIAGEALAAGLSAAAPVKPREFERALENAWHAALDSLAILSPEAIAEASAATARAARLTPGFIRANLDEFIAEIAPPDSGIEVRRPSRGDTDIRWRAGELSIAIHEGRRFGMSNEEGRILDAFPDIESNGTPLSPANLAAIKRCLLDEPAVMRHLKQSGGKDYKAHLAGRVAAESAAFAAMAAWRDDSARASPALLARELARRHGLDKGPERRRSQAPAMLQPMRRAGTTHG